MFDAVFSLAASTDANSLNLLSILKFKNPELLFQTFAYNIA